MSSLNVCKQHPCILYFPLINYVPLLIIQTIKTEVLVFYLNSSIEVHERNSHGYSSINRIMA